MNDWLEDAKKVSLVRISQRLDGGDVRPYTIHRALIEIECVNCEEKIEPGEWCIPYKDRKGVLGEEDELYYYCWECFPDHPRSEEDWGYESTNRMDG